ncbi:hypothetical protein G9A89_011642 [Geosiphon pyriformis]|nr:hypothetical protein G9A89_011642 [Geosiphon pyriformis]
MPTSNLKYYQINKDEAEEKLVKRYVDLASSSLGAKIYSCSDEFFAEAENLLKPEKPVRKLGLYTENGSWMDGWETRRHNPFFDWVIIKLGFAGEIVGLDIDTAHFNGNHAPAASFEACYSPDVDPLAEDSTKWCEILPKVNLNPSSRHFFEIEAAGLTYTHVRLYIYPDGGVARLRVYGRVRAIWPADFTARVDLAYVGNEGRAVACSDQHYGVKDNLLLPGRGKDMGDGWETKRSRESNHSDWVIIKLGHPGYLETAEIDTAHFKGNFPQTVTLDGCFSEAEIPDDNIEWDLILSKSKLEAHKQHVFTLKSPLTKFTHVRMTIFPDGGVKRLRVFGRRELLEHLKTEPASFISIPFTNQLPVSDISLYKLIAEPLTNHAYAAYGQIISSFIEANLYSPNSVSITNGIKVTPANQGTARKFNHVARLINFRQNISTDKEGRLLARAEPNLSIFRCRPATKLPIEVKLLERHPYSSQSFIPMGEENFRGYLVIVCLNGNDDKPNLSTLRAFVASRTQGINYNPGVWHHPMIPLEETTNFACFTYESGVSLEDCEEITLDDMNSITVEVPGFRGSEELLEEKENGRIEDQLKAIPDTTLAKRFKN